MILIVDIGLGNVGSVRSMFDRIGIATELRQSPSDATADDRYVLPGVGSFDEGIRRLHETSWFDHIRALPARTQILGICLGMQLLGESSEEGTEKGLGRAPVRFKRFDVHPLRVPHMGWNRVKAVSDDPIFDPDTDDLRFYFTHSYHAVCDEGATEIGQTKYGVTFTSAYRVGNTRGVQFHPEKSHKFGISLLSRWASLSC